MANDSLKRQLEDMEEAAEKWRSERRRLNAEIDKLEGELADAKASAARKRATEGKPAAPDPALILKIQEAADEKLKKATAEWETEREKLKSQINRLEGAVTEAIARASNPLRATQSVKEQFEAELDRVVKEKTELEQAFLRAKTEWEQEKLKSTGEMLKLRRSAEIMGKPAGKGDDKADTNPRVRDLEDQLKESLAKWSGEREQLTGQIRKLEESSRQWETERRQLNDHAAQLQLAVTQAEAKAKGSEAAAREPNEKVRDLENQLKDSSERWSAEREKLVGQIRKFEESTQSWETERRQLNDHAAQLKQAFMQAEAKIKGFEAAAREPHTSEEKIEELKHDKDVMQRKLQDAKESWDAERRRLEQQLHRMSENTGRVSNEVVDQLRKQYEDRLHDAIHQKTQLAEQLQNASTLLEAERVRLSAAQTQTGGATNSGLDTEAIQAEVSRVEKQIHEIIAIIDDPDTELATIIRKNVEKAELDSYLRGIMFSLGKK